MNSTTNTTPAADFAPVHIGTTPAGVEWIAYRPEHVEPMRERFAKVVKIQGAVRDLRGEIEAEIALLRRKVFRLQGQARKTWRVNAFGERCLGVPADTLPGYAEARDRIALLRKNLRRLSR